MTRHNRRFDPRVPKSARARLEPLAVEDRALPTQQRMRRAGADFERGDTGQITMRDSPLERAYARKLINHQQYSMGQKYRHHWYHAGLADQLSSADLNRIFATGLGNYSGMAKTEAQVSFTDNVIGKRRRPSVRSDHMSWNGRCAAKFHWIRSATRWAGAPVHRHMPPRWSG